MWGTSSPDDKLTGDLGNVIEATQIGGRQSDRLMRENYHRAILDFCNKICRHRSSPFLFAPGTSEPTGTFVTQSSTTSLFRHGTGVRCALGNHTMASPGRLP